jgi:DNA-binding transcriptional MerR regulator
MMTPSPNDPTFGISAVSNLTGIPLDTLRVWERRYSLVVPQRSVDNKRQYSRTDVARLKLIKQLVDRGHAVSAVAHLPEEALNERLQVHLATTPLPHTADEQPKRSLVFGDALPFLVEPWKSELEGVELVGGHTNYADFEKDALALRPEVLIVEMPAIQPDKAEQLQQLMMRTGAGRAVVVYNFAMRRLLERLQKNGVFTLRAPVTAAALASACTTPAGAQAAPPPPTPPMDEPIPPRRFDGETLAAMANLSSKIRCECPRHLADLLFRLTAFEAYSADCENRNEQDAEVHARLHRATAHARVLIEEALDYVIEAEDIDLV